MAKQNRSIPVMVVFFCFLLSGCGSKQCLAPSEYIHFLCSSSCGLNKTKIENNIQFVCKLQPPELITLLANGPIYKNAQAFEIEKQNYVHQLNVIFLIQDPTPAEHKIKETVFNKDLYSSLLNYCNTELQNDFDLQLSGGETVPCSFVHVESANSAQPFIRVNVVFNNVNPDIKDYTVVFDDNLFNSGRIKFFYEQELFDHLPILKI